MDKDREDLKRRTLQLEDQERDFQLRSQDIYNKLLSLNEHLNSQNRLDPKGQDVL